MKISISDNIIKHYLKNVYNFNSWMNYKPVIDYDWENTGFFTYKRTDYENDTCDEVVAVLAKHFGLE